MASQLAAAAVDIDALLASMTLEEKAGQLSLYASVDANPSANPAHLPPDVSRQLDDIRAGRVTGLFNGTSLAAKRRAQEAAVNESRLGIPLLFAADVIHGLRTVFPVPLAEAASWEPALAERTARAAAVEAAREGVRWTFAPMVDIARDARWGRGVEGAGEDVLLASRFAAARVRGFQGSDLAAADAVLATPKHFVAYGAAEGGLDYNTVDVSDLTVRETYLPPFKAAFDAGALAVMTAFNEIAGTPMTAHARWLQDLLRGEWRFPGVVISDYHSDAELVAHGFAVDERQAAKLAFLAGTDISMESGLYARYLPSLVASGEVPPARLDEAVRRVLALKAKIGLFEAPMRGLESPPGPPPVEHMALAREAARRSIVLLKNERGLLPLPKSGRRLALIGPFAGGPADLHGPWTLFPGGTPPVSLEAGLRGALIDPDLLTVTRGADAEAAIPGGIDAAVRAAREADVVLLAIGESEAMSGEARSRAEIILPPAQQALAEAVAATGKPMVVLLRNGRALALAGAVQDAPALLVTWFLGSQTGHAVADVLFGDAAPSGRLPVSFPQSPGQVPLYYAHKPTGRPAPREGEAPGFYNTRYLGTRHAALYPFGHGLGYGHVRYGPVDVGEGRLPWNGKLRIRALLTNDGPREQDEVAQLYVRDRSASVTRPVRELKDFRRIRIAAGATVEAEFELSRGDLGFIGSDLQPTVEPGRFDVWIAPSAERGSASSFELLPPAQR